MERLSALIDGELEAQEVDRELALIKGDLEREATWSAYHLIGDVIRGEHAGTDSTTAAVRDRLRAEPTVLAPRLWKIRRATRRVALPIAASVSAAAVVAWLALSTNTPIDPAPPALIASAPESLPQADQSDADAMSEYLMAHQQFSPSTAMQGVVPYVRTVAATNNTR